ncbi:SDR family NAD(P)-dependent oxidoreductase [Dermabacteraceae bacterium P7054]
MHRALITGGTSGIGAAFARAFARRKMDLVLVARNAQRLEESASELRNKYGVRVECLAADLGDDAGVQAVAQRLLDDTDPVDFFVANAGFSTRFPIISADEADYANHDAAIDVMVRAVYRLCGTAAYAMRERGHGWIVTTSSVSGLVSQNNYSAIKAWATNYTESLNVQLRGSGVQATALCPGWVRTEFHQRGGVKGTSIPGPLWMEADRVVEDCLADVARGRALSIPGKRYRFLAFWLRHLPRSAVYRISAALTSRRAKED